MRPWQLTTVVVAAMALVAVAAFNLGIAVRTPDAKQSDEDFLHALRTAVQCEDQLGRALQVAIDCQREEVETLIACYGADAGTK